MTRWLTATSTNREPTSDSEYEEGLSGRISATSGADHGLINALPMSETRYLARRDVVREGAETQTIQFVIDGWAARYVLLPNGARQITAVLLPGDLCDPAMATLGTARFGVVALTPVAIGSISAADAIRYGAVETLKRASWWAMTLEASTLRERIGHIAKLSALVRVAHLLCEIHARLMSIGRADSDRFEFLLTQADIGDATGLTGVHVNRVMRTMRDIDLIQYQRPSIIIPDIRNLHRAASFDPKYLLLAEMAAR